MRAFSLQSPFLEIKGHDLPLREVENNAQGGGGGVSELKMALEFGEAEEASLALNSPAPSKALPPPPGTAEKEMQQHRGANLKPTRMLALDKNLNRTGVGGDRVNEFRPVLKAKKRNAAREGETGYNFPCIHVRVLITDKQHV